MPIRPVILAGSWPPRWPTLPDIQPDQSVIFVEEPMSSASGRADQDRRIDGHPGPDRVEYQLPGKADEFYHAHRDLEPAAVIPLTEYATPFAARLAERYGLPAGSAAAGLLRDKALLRNVTRGRITNPRSIRWKARRRRSRSCTVAPDRAQTGQPAGVGGRRVIHHAGIPAWDSPGGASTRAHDACVWPV